MIQKKVDVDGSCFGRMKDAGYTVINKSEVLQEVVGADSSMLPNNCTFIESCKYRLGRQAISY
jgi:hypothetical protein